MGIVLDLVWLKEEEVLAFDVVGVVQRQRVLLHERLLPTRPAQAELTGGQVAPLLSPHGLEAHGTHPARGLESEVAGGNPLGEETGVGRELIAHVAHLDPL